MEAHPSVLAVFNSIRTMRSAFADAVSEVQFAELRLRHLIDARARAAAHRRLPWPPSTPTRIELLLSATLG
jgi:hypothetical protein